MSYEEQSEGSKALDQREHNRDASAKRVVLRAQDPSTSSWVNIAAVDNGDGTYSISTSSTDGGGGTTANASYNAVSVTGTATLVKAALTTRKSIVITHETAGETLYIGKNSSVTTSTGIPIEQHQYIGWDDYEGDVYAISDGTTVSARYFEVG